MTGPASARFRPPAMTITMPADRLGAAALGWLREALTGFVLYRSGTGVTLRHNPCGELWPHYRTELLTAVVREALEHHCELPDNELGDES